MEKLQFTSNHEKQLLLLLKHAPASVLEKLAEAFDSATSGGAVLPLDEEHSAEFRDTVGRCLDIAFGR